MDVKLFEIRDRATCIPAMAVRLRSRGPREFTLLRRAGYGFNEIAGPEEAPGTLAGGFEPYVVLCQLDGLETNYDPFSWSNKRTMTTAHQFIIAHWGDTPTGSVIDVRVLLGEATEPAPSDVSPGPVRDDDGRPAWPIDARD